MDLPWPGFLWALGLVPLAILAYLLGQRRRAGVAVRFANPDLVPNVITARRRWRRHLPALLYLLALPVLVLALARPQATVLVPEEQATVMLVMDVSGSMNATDVTPTRLVAAQRAASSFLNQLPSRFRVGLVTFSSTAQLMVRPTTDRVAVQDALASLQAEGAPPWVTASSWPWRSNIHPHHPPPGPAAAAPRRRPDRHRSTPPRPC